MQVLASQLPFLANRKAGQAVPPISWPVNCIKSCRVALLFSPFTVSWPRRCSPPPPPSTLTTVFINFYITEQNEMRHAVQSSRQVEEKP